LAKSFAARSDALTGGVSTKPGSVVRGRSGRDSGAGPGSGGDSLSLTGGTGTGERIGAGLNEKAMLYA
jgi:hypothetical protein